MKKFIYILILFSGCKDVYVPTLKNATISYLVVEGDIGAGNDSTLIHITRTIPVSDTSLVQPETNATVAVESDDGDTYQLQNISNGDYYSPPLNINPNKNYRLHIFTADGKEYASEYVAVKLTPPIDSVSWKYDETDGINIYATTHDVTNNSQYYRFQYVSTYEHRSVDSSELIYQNGMLRFRFPQEEVYRCWNIYNAGEIFLSSTTGLSSDVVFEKKIVSYPYEAKEFRWVYSILVTEYALTKEGFEYWTNLKKNTENLGSIFDPQPFAEFGNIHCITNPSEPVIGFISACSTSNQRLYIYYSQVHYPYILPDCKEIIVGPNQIDEVFSQYLYLPLRYGDFGAVKAYPVYCLDCRFDGGTTSKPPYMP